MKGTMWVFLAALLACATAAGCSSSQKNESTPPPSGDGKSADETDGAAAADACVKTGCSGTVCAAPGNEVVTTCEWKPEYACYQNAACERQADGSCGWTQTPALQSCLASPPKE